MDGDWPGGRYCPWLCGARGDARGLGRRSRGHRDRRLRQRNGSRGTSRHRNRSGRGHGNRSGRWSLGCRRGGRNGSLRRRGNGNAGRRSFLLATGRHRRDRGGERCGGGRRKQARQVARRCPAAVRLGADKVFWLELALLNQLPNLFTRKRTILLLVDQAIPSSCHKTTPSSCGNQPPAPRQSAATHPRPVCAATGPTGGLVPRG
jgi:hypothetical protein